MDWLEPVAYIAGLILTFVIGKVQEKPGYKKVKNVAKLLVDAAEDNVITGDEVKAIVDAVQKKNQ